MRLLADDAVAEGDPLVLDARRKTAGPEAGQDDVGVAQALDAIGRGRDPEVEPAHVDHALGDAPDHVEMGRIEIDQRDLGAGEGRAALDERGDGAGGAGAAAADVGELDPGHGPSLRVAGRQGARVVGTRVL